MTMTHIETVTVGSGGAASITFSAIPADTYTDLLLVLSTREETGTDGNVRLSINGNTTSLTARDLEGGGSSASSSSRSFIAIVTSKSTDTANTFGNAQVYFPNYASSANKSISVNAVSENNGTTAFQSILAGLRSNTDPITSISLAAPSGDIAEFSSASLYGVLAGSDGIVAVS